MSDARGPLPSEDETEAGNLLREFAADRAPLAALRELLEVDSPPPPRELFRELGQLDVFAQALPEEQGGLGMSATASGLMVEAAGSELMPGPVIDQLVSARVLGPHADLAAPLIAGEQLFALALAELRIESDQLSCSVDGIVLGPQADRWLLLGESSWALVDPADVATDATVADRPIDPLRPTFSAMLEEVPAQSGRIEPAEREGLLAYAYGIAAMWSLGAARRLLDLTVEYTRERKQFGQPIGSFQAIKHRAASAYVEILHARYLAAAALVAGEIAAARLARIAADEAYRAVAASCLQMHGGIGFTSEASVHLFLKNAELMRRWPLSAGAERDAVRAALELDPA